MLSEGRRSTHCAAALVAAALCVAGCGEGGGDGKKRTHPVADTAPRRATGGPATIDAAAGTYRGVGIGSSRAEAGRVLGRSTARSQDPLSPLGKEPLDVGVPPSPKEPRGLDPIDVWRFRDAALLADRGKAWLIVVSAADARTKEGVGVGDALGDARAAYSEPQCGVANEGTEYVQFRYCQVRVRPGRYAWFAYNPVRSITLSRARLIAGD